MNTTHALNSLKQLRRQATKKIKRAVKPHLHGSGYANGTDEGLPLVVLKRGCKLRFPLTYGLQEGIMGFTDYGIITDAHAGGLSTMGYEQIAVEDLLKLERTVAKLTPAHYKK